MNALWSKEADEIRGTWQSRILVATEGLERAVIIRMFVSAYKDAIRILLAATFPGFRDLKPPQIIGHAKIAPSGRVIADVLEKNRSIRTHILFESQDQMRARFAAIADKMKLDDIGRVELFAMLQKWVVADLRFDHNGQRLAS